MTNAPPNATLLLALLVPPQAALLAQSSPAPAPAYSVGAAYDTGRSRFIVFGGYRDGRYVGSTHAWDGSVWSLIAGSVPEAARP